MSNEQYQSHCTKNYAGIRLRKIRIAFELRGREVEEFFHEKREIYEKEEPITTVSYVLWQKILVVLLFMRLLWCSHDCALPISATHAIIHTVG